MVADPVSFVVGCAAVGAAWGWAAPSLAARAAAAVKPVAGDPPRGAVRVLGTTASTAAFAGCALRFGATPTLAAVVVFVAGATVLAWSDGRWMVLPSRVVYPTLLVLGAVLLPAAWVGHEWGRLAVGAGCALAAFGLLLAVNALNPRWLAFGDARFALVVALALGWVGVGSVLAGFVAANVLGLIVAGVGILRRRLQANSPLPFGLFLAVGGVLALLVR